MTSTYAPVYANPLLNLSARTSPVPFRDAGVIQNYGELKLPNVEKAVNETAVLLSHTYLLGDGTHMQQLVDGIAKVNDNLGAIQRHFEAEEVNP